MTTILSASAATSREAARKTDGKFGHQAHAEADLDLSFDAPDAAAAGASDLLDKSYGPDAPELREARAAHDTEMAKLMGEKADKMFRRDRTLVELRHHIGERQQYYRGRGTWTLSPEEVLEKAQAKVEAKDFRWQDSEAALGRYDGYVAEIEEVQGRIAPMKAVYEQNPWNRAFLATSVNGHVHTSTNCSTCNKMGKPTEFEWRPEYSGAGNQEIIDDAGYRACTTCVPGAPVEATAASHPTKMFTAEERDKEAERIAREAKRAAAKQAKLEKGIALKEPHELRVSMKIRPGWDARGRTTDTETLKTERTAVQWLAEHSVRSGNHRDYSQAITDIEETLVSKRMGWPEE
ncbi:hypothetical protein [Kocuria arenosa]|uniref:hypothetical protein n=1 Tax=Kocuria arenosa TaxID=3071446 RepID=UPI0034D4CBF6